MIVLHATSYKLHSRKRAIHGMRATRQSYATYFGASVINADGSILENRWSWDPALLERWLSSFGLTASFVLEGLD